MNDKMCSLLFIIFQGIRRPISKHRPVSIAVKEMPNKHRMKNIMSEVQEDGDFSHYYSESIELNPIDIYSSSYENINIKK